jgi:hypothetical protein
MRSRVLREAREASKPVAGCWPFGQSWVAPRQGRHSADIQHGAPATVPLNHEKVVGKIWLRGTTLVFELELVQRL